MTLSNKIVQYSVSETGTNLSINAQISLSEQDHAIDFSGSFLGAEGAYIGSFNYSEKEGIVADKTISGVNKTLLVEAQTLLDTTVEAVITELNF